MNVHSLNIKPKNLYMSDHTILHSEYIMKVHKKVGVLEFVKEKRVITTSELASQLHISWNTAEKYLLELALDNKVERMKKEGVNLWLSK